MENNEISISLCFPAFNEEANIKEAISSSVTVLDKISSDWEIIVVDDGSSDTTAEIVEKIALSEKRVRLLRHDKNRGYGAALKSGFYSATKQWIWLNASDNQFNPEDIYELLPYTQDYEVISGYRFNRADPLYRKINARLYHLFIYAVLGLNLKDMDCGFKLIRSDVFKVIALKSEGALIDAEFFAKCEKQGFKVKEVMVGHKPRRHGTQTGASVFVIAKMFVEVFKLKMRENL